MTQDLKKFNNFFWKFPHYLLLLKSYHYNLKMTAPIFLKKTFSGSQKRFSEKSLRFKWLRPFLLAFLFTEIWFLPAFVVVVFIVIRRVVMSYL